VSASPDPLRAALATGLLASEAAHRELLDSVVAVARAIFGARASSIMLHHPERGELVFEAVAGEGSGRLVGTGFPAGQGVAGWVLGSGQAIVLEDVEADPRFARDVAERSGYVPKGLMAAPLEGRDGVLGVLQVLDRPQRARFSLQEMDLLGLFAAQAAVALEIVQAARAGRRAVTADGAEGGAVARLAAALGALEPSERVRADAVLDAVAALLESR
jgi:GAF domain-containing protein